MKKAIIVLAIIALVFISIIILTTDSEQSLFDTEEVEEQEQSEPTYVPPSGQATNADLFDELDKLNGE